MTHLRIDTYSHGARLYGYSRDTFRHLAYFLSQFELREDRRLPPHQGGQTISVVKKRFFGALEDNTEIYIHRHHVPVLLRYLEGCGIEGNRVEVNAIPPPSGVSADLPVKDFFTERDYQKPIIVELADELPSRKLDLATGMGKTFSSLKACANRGERVAIMLAPKYFGLWTGALIDTFEGWTEESGHFLTVSGSSELKAVMQRALDGQLEEVGAILISNTTYRKYIETYEKFGEKITEYGYAVVPQRFHELMGFGIQLNDEFHEDLGLTFRIDVYTNVAKQVYLSATPYNGDDFVTQMVDVMLPPRTHCTVPEPPKYINVIELLYHDDVKKEDYLTPHKGHYNHARYEGKMLKKKRRRNIYFDNVKRVVEKAFVENFEPGQKLLILCATVDFIKELTEYLRIKFPKVKIGHYVSGVAYETVAQNDITVSTIKSAGTGVDIRNLRDTLLLQAVNSRKDNIQILGRTRPLKDWPDVTPRLLFFTCLDIPKHRQYARSKREFFAGRILNARTLRL